jgi:hypothetical protein
MRRVAGPLAAVAAVCLLWAAPARGEDLVVVVSRDSKVDHITAEDVGRIYRGELRVLAGDRATPMDYAAQVTFRDKFLKKVMGTDDHRFTTFWLLQIYRNGRVPPVRVASPADALAHVAGHPGTVAYVRPSDIADAAGEGVRVVLELPCDENGAGDAPMGGHVDPIGPTDELALFPVTPIRTATRD